MDLVSQFIIHKLFYGGRWPLQGLKSAVPLWPLSGRGHDPARRLSSVCFLKLQRWIPSNKMCSFVKGLSRYLFTVQPSSRYHCCALKTRLGISTVPEVLLILAWFKVIQLSHVCLPRRWRHCPKSAFTSRSPSLCAESFHMWCWLSTISACTSHKSALSPVPMHASRWTSHDLCDVLFPKLPGAMYAGTRSMFWFLRVFSQSVRTSSFVTTRSERSLMQRSAVWLKAFMNCWSFPNTASVLCCTWIVISLEVWFFLEGILRACARCDVYVCIDI